MKKHVLTLTLLSTMHLMFSQAYVMPTDPLVLQKLDWWQDQKFGLMMHWGTYSQWGVVESWSICSEDQPWCSRNGADYSQYKRDYEALATTFNPQKFDPQPWVNAAKYAGMKYLVFTTKHHDGFCMFDTKETDYRITGSQVPFHTDPRADVTKVLFDSFRNQGFGIGAYFSKPDWHSPDFWAPEWATPDRCTNYDTNKHPDRWQKFRDYTYNQIEELMSGYGKVDILWLDGGWVRPDSTINEEVRSWGYRIPDYPQDIDMPRIATMARAHQPGLLVVDRSVHGPFEDYRTPEQQVPERALSYPWETCMTMGNSWSYSKNPHYKSTHQLIHLLVDIVAKGGNFLLNIGPSPDGTWDQEAFDRLQGIGDWMQVNQEAIYATRAIAPYKEGKIRFTRKKNTNTVYAIYLADEQEKNPPEYWSIQQLKARTGSKVSVLETGDELSWKPNGDQGMIIQIPEKVRQKMKSQHAWTILFEADNIHN
ncbi:MAG: alpha-L-fucosidase [Saprospiraceae bacterium]|nr:alpha-L-fucosidase [Saprospiraceae bacterium]MCB9319631.1 alpha-L-fucosidase [Lewinellaceae bacterium]